jgi:hypothetical protein
MNDKATKGYGDSACHESSPRCRLRDPCCFKGIYRSHSMCGKHFDHRSLVVSAIAAHCG